MASCERASLSLHLVSESLDMETHDLSVSKVCDARLRALCSSLLPMRVAMELKIGYVVVYIVVHIYSTSPDASMCVIRPSLVYL